MTYGFFEIFRINEFKAEINRLDEENRSLRGRLDSIGADDYYSVKEMTDNLSNYSEALKTEIASLEREIAAIKNKMKSVKTQTNIFVAAVSDEMLDICLRTVLEDISNSAGLGKGVSLAY